MKSKNTLVAVLAWLLPNSYAFIDVLTVFYPTINLQIVSSFLAAVAILLFFIQIYYKKYELMLFQVALLFIALLYTTRFFYHENFELYQSFYNSFLIRSFPAILVAMMLSRYNRIKEFIKWSEPYMLLYTLAVFITSFAPRNSIISYQALSYYSMTAYMLTIFSAVYRKNLLANGLTFFKFRSWTPICYGLMIVQLYTMLYGGGRGAFILCIIFTLIFFKKIFTSPRLFTVFLMCTLVLVIGLILTDYIDISQILNNDGVRRLVNFFGRYDRISGYQRLVLYERAWESIQERPLLGWGIGSTLLRFNGYSHNIFLDILHDTGLIGLSIMAFLMTICTIFWYKIRSIDWKIALFGFMIIETMVHMNFSGSYLADGRLWFWFTFIYCYYRWKKDEKNEVSNSTI
ncbi:TPA: O-antigen ligase family protein [Streptococcus suis]|nr:O-antigen ligase family protein [Streptococcus suis]NQN72842.1 O-antigen ligase family protein [Streptococcus suis]HEL2684712.1 O-antigen ligase family protein [Streptococcus suis]HEP1832512.1 O-antigen ligase family protein [Streptococcus suis]